MRAIRSQPNTEAICLFNLLCCLFCFLLASSMHVDSSCGGDQSLNVGLPVLASSLLGRSAEYVRGIVKRPVMVSTKKGKNCP